MQEPLTILISAGQSRSPDKRSLEEAIANAVGAWDNVRVISIPHLYDLVVDGPSVQRMRQANGPIVALSWLYERASHWVLDRLGVHGCLEPTEFTEVDPDEEDLKSDTQPKFESTVYSRPIHCIDLRARDNADDFVAELKRLANFYRHAEIKASNLPSESTDQANSINFTNLFFDEEHKGIGKDEPSMDLELFASHVNESKINTKDQFASAHTIEKVIEHPTRRWYPVIDFSRCTNCMECIDFCLFGVYGVDHHERILVEQPDNCRKGCPACSRVCPANAIMFPQHKTPAIAGALAGDASFKIDLSKLFGAPESNEDAAVVAARERDEHLILAGREAVGMPAKESTSIGMRTTAVIKSQWKAETAEKDSLDQLIDQLDKLNL